MAKLLLSNVKPLVNGKLISPLNILIEDGKISDLLPLDVKADDCEIFDGNGMIACAGFIDIHFHGGFGCDIMEATADALEKSGDFHLKNGTTTYYPTTMTAPEKDIVSALANIRSYCGSGARIAGCHLEGPFLSGKAAGAHPQEYLLNPDKANTQFILDNIDVVKRITVAPNLSGAAFLTELCLKNGIQVSLGHDNSIDEEIYGCISKGASSVTHLYNCTSRPSRRETPKKYLGLTEIGMIENALTAEVIADDRHVPNKLFEMIFKLKGAKNIVFVSDSLSVAGMKSGDYYLGSGDAKQIIRVEDGVATLPAENTYAGSITPIAKMVKNIYDNTSISMEDCLIMGTLTAKKLMYLTDRGDICKGYLADINLFDENLNLKKTVFKGKLL